MKVSYNDQLNLNYIQFLKTFSCTGWRIGFGIGPKQLIKYAILTHQYTSFSINAPTQIALANCLKYAEKPYKNFDSYYEYFNNLFEKNRNLLIKEFNSLKGIGLKLNKPEGGYFILGSFEHFAKRIPQRYLYKDYENIENGDKEIGENFDLLKNSEVSLDQAFSTYLAVENKVAVTHLSQFYKQITNNLNEQQGKYLYRISLSRKEQTYQDAIERLSKIKK